jgi:hypothetical protein
VAVVVDSTEHMTGGPASWQLYRSTVLTLGANLSHLMVWVRELLYNWVLTGRPLTELFGSELWHRLRDQHSGCPGGGIAQPANGRQAVRLKAGEVWMQRWHGKMHSRGDR